MIQRTIIDNDKLLAYCVLHDGNLGNTCQITIIPRRENIATILGDKSLCKHIERALQKLANTQKE